MNSQSSPLYEALLHGMKAYKLALPSSLEHPLLAISLPPILNIQMDNATGNNKNKFVFCLWSLFIANKIL